MRTFQEYAQFQVFGATVQTFVEGFGAFTVLAAQFLMDEQIGVSDNRGGLVVEKERLYPMRNLLLAFARMGKELGDLPLRQAGLTMQKTAIYPPEMLRQDIAGAFRFIDIGYYLNHAEGGKPLYDLKTHTMRHIGGIGHYAFKAVPGQKELKGVVDIPYPCPYTHGVILGVAQRFAATATTTHDPGPCRKKGDKACHYTVKWT